MRTISLSLLAAVVVAGCTSLPNLPNEAPTALASKPISIEEAFRGANALPPGLGSNISIVAGRVPLVSLGNANLLVVPATIGGSRPHTIRIRSYVTRTNDGTLVLFYPVLSFVDSNFRVYQTVKPKYEFAFEQNVLTNEFEIPPSVERLLIHAAAEDVRGSFVGTTSSSPSSGASDGASALGGVAGFLILQAVTPSENREFKLGEVGIISIETR